LEAAALGKESRITDDGLIEQKHGGASVRSVVRLLVALCCILAGLTSAQAEKRVALIIGNWSYAHIAGLPNVRNDAAAIFELLRTADFGEIDAVYNLNVDQLRRALKMFAGKAADADVAVLYYAGHGIEVGQANYLIPVDARLATDFDVEDETVPLDRVLQAMEPAKRLRLVLLDACRENPFLKSMKRAAATRSVGRGLGRVEPTTANTLIAFATKPNAVAEDGKGPNSPFTAALVKHLLTPGLDLRLALGKVRDEVIAGTGGKQEPYVTSSLGGEIVSIIPGVSGVGPLTLAPHPNEAAEAWAAVKDSTSIAQLEVIAGRYKGTVYVDFAQARIAELRKKQVALAAPPVTDPDILTRLKGPLTPGDIFQDCDVCPEMVVAPGGSFIMGSSPAETDALVAETKEDIHRSQGPQHRVTIAKPFAIGGFEVTFAEWDSCVADAGCQRNPPDGKLIGAGWGRGRMPVINVSWDSITKEYLPWLSRKAGKTYRLPTEAEWEYAARAGTTTRYAFGDAITKYQAQFSEGKWGSTGRPVEVGSFPPNSFRLHDMHGNVGEWVQDCWNASYDGAPMDGSAWLIGDCKFRVVRGGSWYGGSRSARSAHREGALSFS
jgi:formylglycine-generating enzyme required for sulfatase activity